MGLCTRRAGGHINHFWEAVSAAKESRMENGDWHVEVDEAEEELETQMVENQNKIKGCRGEQEAKVSANSDHRIISPTTNYRLFTTVGPFPGY